MGLDFRMDLCWIGSNLSLVVFLFLFFWCVRVWGGGGYGLGFNRFSLGSNW